MRPVRVFLGAAFGPAAHSVMHGLTHQSEIPVEIFAGDADASHLQFAQQKCKEVFLVPRTDSETFADTLLGVLHAVRPTLYIPILDSELLKVATLRPEIERLGCQVFLAKSEDLSMTLDKRKMYGHCVSEGIPHASLLCDETIPAHSYPVFLKPARGVGGKDCHVIHSAEDLTYWKNRITDVIVQNHITGVEYTVDIFIDNNTIVGAVPRERMECKNGISVKGRTVVDTELVKLASQAARAFNARGICNIQCFREKDTNRLLFSEINMRPGGASILSIQAGCNIPLLLLKRALGEPISDQERTYEPNVLMLRYWSEHFQADKRRSDE